MGQCITNTSLIWSRLYNTYYYMIILICEDIIYPLQNVKLPFRAHLQHTFFIQHHVAGSTTQKYDKTFS